MKDELQPIWHTLDAQTALRRLEVDPKRGLSSERALRRLEAEGPNELQEGAAVTPLRILARQFTSLMVLLLIASAAVSGLVLREWEDAAVIAVIVVLNALLGFWQEFRAERALAALKSLAAPEVRVLRDAVERSIPSRELVRGDVVLVEAGSLIPADCRILGSANLKVREAALTGEAAVVEKNAEALEDRELPLGDRRNMLYMGTMVSYGRGTAVVTATGMASELGNVAALIRRAQPEKTVLQGKLAALSLVLVAAALGLIGVVALEGWLLQGQGLKELFLTAVSMAVAAIPEGLPAVVTIALALGAQRMLRRRALIRRLPAVETLGSITVICSDKTGTLTQNRMTVTVLDLLDRRVEPSGAVVGDSAAWLLLAGGALCSDAVLKADNGGQQAGEQEAGQAEGFETLGDPTEGALVASAARAGLDKGALEALLPRVGELPFDSERKRMTTCHSLRGLAEPAGAGASPAATGPAEPASPAPAPQPLSGQLMPQTLRSWLKSRAAASLCFTKGAPDSLLEVSTSVWLPGGSEPLTDGWRRRIRQADEQLASRGIRVLGLAIKTEETETVELQQWERELLFVGLIGMLDPLRPEVKQAVETCRQAGIRPLMITGDHPLIARTIAGELGFENADRFLTGKELARMDAAELAGEVEQISVYARVAPEHKLKIVDALQERGHIVSMTGDGVNDAPALKAADIGVAMGITGTDVSKEAADMVLQDDNFATIVSAVEEGRIIFDNILHFVRYILASNSAEILVMLLAPLFGLPIPLFPVQILWMNLVTDGLPALALGVEPGGAEVMRRPPRRPGRPILTWDTGLHILWVGLLMAGLALAAGGGQYGVAAQRPALRWVFPDPASWRTVLFTTLVLSQLTLALGERSRTRSLAAIGILSNLYMLPAVGLAFCLQIAVVYLPFLQRFFNTRPLTLAQLGFCLASSLIMLAAVEIEKLVLRAFGTGGGPAVAPRGGGRLRR
jgi:Ca2+-transporting ATPase